ncbi:MAG: NAD(P)/FAD-dependent oxidoreductase [Pseudomonadota bacterium]
MNNIKGDVLIIGGGPIGIFAAFQACLLGLEPILVESSNELGGTCKQYREKNIYDIPGYAKITGKGLIDNLYKQLQQFDCKVYLNYKVLSYERQNDFFKVKVLYKKEYIYLYVKSIVLAIGKGVCQFNKPAIYNLNQYIDNIKFEVLNKKQFANKDIMIVGGGDSAVDWVLELSPIVNKLFLVHRRDKFRAMESSVDNMFDLNNVVFCLNSQLYKIDSLPGNVCIYNAQDDIYQQICVDYILCFLGTINNLESIKKWDLVFDNDNIVVDPLTQQTKQELVYAIGDVCTYTGKLKLILTGFSEAAIAIYHLYDKVKKSKLEFKYSTHIM